MMRDIYSYKLGRPVTLLSREEYRPIAEALKSRLHQVLALSKERGISLEESRRCTSHDALALYEGLTGIELKHPEELYAVPQHIYGRLCPKCQRPFRTPKAKLCAECGHTLPQGECAGPLAEY